MNGTACEGSSVFLLPSSPPKCYARLHFTLDERKGTTLDERNAQPYTSATLLPTRAHPRKLVPDASFPSPIFAPDETSILKTNEYGNN